MSFGRWMLVVEALAVHPWLVNFEIGNTEDICGYLRLLAFGIELEELFMSVRFLFIM